MAKLFPFGITGNLIVNGSIDQSAVNFPSYGWLPSTLKESVGVPFAAFSEIKRNKTIKPRLGGKYLFSPIDDDDNILKNMISNIKGAMVYNENNMPGLIPGGYTPGNMPSGHVPSCKPSWMPYIPGLPSMPGLMGMNMPGMPNLTTVPGMPNIQGILGLPGIPFLPGMSSNQKFPGKPNIPFLPGISEIIAFVNAIVDAFNAIVEFFDKLAAHHTDFVQTVDISLWKNFIDCGMQDFNFKGFHCADGGDDTSRIFLEILNENNAVMQTFGNGDDSSNSASWQEFKLPNNKYPNTNLPAGARKIKVTLRVNKSFGHNHYAGFFDDLELTMPVYKIPFTLSAEQVAVGQTVRIYRDLDFTNFKDIVYESLNPDIATVNDIGIVEGKKPGVATIRVSDPVFKDLVTEFNIVVASTVVPVPVILKHPSHATILAGKNATFSVLAMSDPMPNFQWQIFTNGQWTNISNGISYNGAGTNSLTVLNVTNAMDRFEYRCFISNHAGSISSNAASIVIGTLPTISSQPANVTVNEGLNATFSIGATGIPSLGYQWKVYNNGWKNIANNAQYSGASTAKLTISGITKAMSKTNYYCEIKNSLGTVSSQIAMLMVPAAPTITAHPNSRDVSVNPPNDASFHVEANGYPDITWQWQVSTDNGSSWQTLADIPDQISGTKSNSLQIIDTSNMADLSLFRCEVKNELGTDYSYPATLRRKKEDKFNTFMTKLVHFIIKIVDSFKKMKQ